MERKIVSTYNKLSCLKQVLIPTYFRMYFQCCDCTKVAICNNIQYIKNKVLRNIIDAITEHLTMYDVISQKRK